MVFRLMFGGGAFDDVFGDVCELPMLKQMMTTMDRPAPHAPRVRAHEWPGRAGAMLQQQQTEDGGN